MMFGRSLIFVVVAVLFSAVAFPQNGNLSKAETLIGDAKSVNSLLADSSPGIQEGNNVGFIGTGPINLTLNNDLVFKMYWAEGKTSCKTAQFGVCYDAYSPDSAFIGSCSPTQCYMKIYVDERGEARSAGSKWIAHPIADFTSFSFPDFSSSCKPKILNGMIQLNVHSIGCPVKAEDAQIKYPEIPATTTVDPSHAEDSLNQASFWNEGGWIILVVVVCLLACNLLVGGSVSIFYCLKKKRNSVKAPPPPSIIAADKKTVTMGQQPSVVMPNADLQKKKKKNDGNAKKKAAAPPKAKTPPLSGKNPYGGDDTQDYLDLVKSKSYSSKSV